VSAPLPKFTPSLPKAPQLKTAAAVSGLAIGGAGVAYVTGVADDACTKL
jgi:hypothetical protein